MSSKPTYGLLNDSILGHLLCVYLKLSLSANDKYYFVINQTDQLITSNPNFLEKLGICEIKRTFGTELHKQIDQEKQTINHYNQMSVTALASGSPNFYDVHRKKIAIFEKILRKYKIYETPVIYADFEKKDTDSKIHDCLAYVISFDKKQYDKLSKFIRSYNSLFLTKELDGQQNYFLPEIYVNYLISKINNPAYLKLHGYNNLEISKDKEPFFCHSIMALVLSKKIAIRKLLITDKSVHMTFDNLISLVNKAPELKQIKVITEDPRWQKWPIDFKWVTDIEFALGNDNPVRFGKSESDRIDLFKMLLDAKGDWVEVKKMSEKIKKSAAQARVTVGQINNENLKNTIIEIIERNDKSKPGAYRIFIKNKL